MSRARSATSAQRARMVPNIVSLVEMGCLPVAQEKSLNLPPAKGFGGIDAAGAAGG